MLPMVVSIVASVAALPEIYFLTRDCREGVLSDEIEVWCVRPDCLRYEDGDATWIAPMDLVDRQDTLIDTWSLARTLHECHVHPDDARQCIRVGR